MSSYAVVIAGGKQYLVKENDEIVVEKLKNKEKEEIELETLAIFNDQGDFQLGEPVLRKKTKAIIVANLKGDKIRVAKFKAKVRYRKMKGFRSRLSKIKITKI